jgi:hypothetical protein
MARTILCGLLVLPCLLLSIAPVHAQEGDPQLVDSVVADATAEAEPAVAPPAPVADPIQTRGRVASAIVRTLERKAMLNALTASYEVLQAADVITTTLALRNGSLEQNPLLKGFAHHPVRLAIFKASVTTASLILTHRLVKKHRLGGTLLLAGLNGTLAIIVARNMQVEPAR